MKRLVDIRHADSTADLHSLQSHSSSEPGRPSRAASRGQPTGNSRLADSQSWVPDEIMADTPS